MGLRLTLITLLHRGSLEDDVLELKINHLLKIINKCMSGVKTEIVGLSSFIHCNSNE